MEKPVHEKADPPPGKVDETVPASLSVDVKALLSHPEYSGPRRETPLLHRI